MKHFKTIKYYIFSRRSIASRRADYFFHDEKNDVYFVSTDLSSFGDQYQYLSNWSCISKTIHILEFISNNIIIEYFEQRPNYIDIISAHNRMYLRSKKIQKIL